MYSYPLCLNREGNALYHEHFNGNDAGSRPSVAYFFASGRIRIKDMPGLWRGAERETERERERERERLEIGIFLRTFRGFAFVIAPVQNILIVVRFCLHLSLDSCLF